MGRGVSAGGGQSSWGKGSNSDPSSKPIAVSQPLDACKPAGIQSSTTNNYSRTDRQNCGNFLTGRPSTKVHAAPGRGSSLDYLFGGGSK